MNILNIIMLNQNHLFGQKLLMKLLEFLKCQKEENLDQFNEILNCLRTQESFIIFEDAIMHY